MAETVRVRDHSRPCEHGSQWTHWFGAKPKWWQAPDCPGGKEMILRRVADGTWIEVEDGDSDPGSMASA